MTETERWITVASLINAGVFYTLIIIVFLTTRKTRLNKALATQKAFWLIIITMTALPAYLRHRPFLGQRERMTVWVALSVSTWWVLYEVYQANWSGNFWSFLCFIARSVRASVLRDARRTREMLVLWQVRGHPMCRDCSKCTERSSWRTTKRLANLVLIVCTLGLSVVISAAYRSNRRLCPACGHPLAWHARDAIGRYKD